MSQDLNLSAHSHALDEETARAEIYGLLSQLFYAAPAAELLGQLQVAVTEAPDAGAFLEEPWRELVACARGLTESQIASEYNQLFGGVGKPEIYLFGSHYISGFLNEKPLVRLRDDLAALGLGRSEDMSETEDHAAYVFEVMRYLIAGDDVTVSNLTHQLAFFSQHVKPWLPLMCQAVMAHPKAVFYARLAHFTEGFLSVEAQGFDLVT
ncbi:molecular chaperone TorD family protein [Limnohabitans sp. Rim8]|uniref:TorD/DmsD family molecular chaperone n=1 Tax=Limnohabitans sp. Rim8 TaxID=1100718 RepID=UPI002632AE64|nr:molecular chaperone TorD family protein [Limnohabitans sp. Rim8]